MSSAVYFNQITLVSKRSDIIQFYKKVVAPLISVTVISELQEKLELFSTIVIYDYSLLHSQGIKELYTNISSYYFSKIIFLVPSDIWLRPEETKILSNNITIPFPCNKYYLLNIIENLNSNKSEVKTPFSLRNFADQPFYKDALRDLVGNSQIMHNLREEIIFYSQLDTPLLIYGETGTGKSTIARIIHSMSSRKENDFIGVNSSVLSNSFADTALFGAIEGAYTDGKEQKGFFQDADKGTIFFDEISLTSVMFQAKLLTVLDSGVIYKVGNNTKPIQVDVRPIFATNDDLKQKIVEGTFRKDLYFRIAPNIINVPPLREHREDIFCIASRLLGLQNKELSEEALRKLEDYYWPGNIRQLERCMEKAISLSENSNIIKLQDIIF